MSNPDHDLAWCRARGVTTYSDDELQRRFREQLNGQYGTVSVCGYDFQAGDVLWNHDEGAFNEQYAAWLDAQLRNRHSQYIGLQGDDLVADRTEYEEAGEEEEEEMMQEAINEDDDDDDEISKD